MKRLLLLALLAACDNPSAVREPPPIRSMTFFMILDPDAATQPLLVRPASAYGRLEQLAGRVERGSQVVAALAPAEDESHDFYACSGRYGGLNGYAYPRCLDFDFRPEFGATYTVRGTARGYPSASATTTVPGDFRIVSVRATGTPPGTQGLQATWTRSAGAFRYVVALRSQGLVKCLYRSTECAVDYEPHDWLLVTTDTTFSTIVPAEGVGRGQPGEWLLDVYAMERSVFEYLTTGSVAQPYPIPPVQNVRGGYGAVGAWVRRSENLGSHRDTEAQR
ncbi:MAG: hypothetical protein AVDCRST_MAG68-3091 [uncultured Gemmatimonadetes bacterium]|uniref:Uncharacterized protein n=1 Tax=uncultured Gemmatimonadota bacterium TaxID=203437 RepID=A0A6J4LWL1_9BACT|nr:MAG: hypothetical protein AVDCRST_MAG68-3091 [uncultured Gemmatimonadota bacterium]